MNHNEFLANLLALSEAMLEHGRRGEWEDVERLEAVRRQGLEACFEKPVAAGDASTARGLLERILETDAELTALATRNRDEAGAQLAELRTGRRATAAYAANV
ncbi:MAG: flagellar protein FliT [Hydrogenophaga sp.]|nr:flagellar protein FliT [Gammaproteobacteria bacterium]